MDCLPASFANSKSIFYMAKLLIAFNLVSKEESVQQLAPQQLMSISLWLLPREWRAQHKLF